MYRPDRRAVGPSEVESVSSSFYYSGRQGPMNTRAGVVTFGVVFGLLGGMTVLLTRRRDDPQPYARPRPMQPTAPAPMAMGHPGCELRRVSIGLDWRARAQVQSELAAIAASMNPNDPAGLHRTAGRTLALLDGALGSARYGRVDGRALAPESAEHGFTQWVNDLGGRYTVETVTHARRVAAPKVTAQAEEGMGLVVVTVLLAVRGALPATGAGASREELRHALRSSLPPSDALLALEVIWSPSEDSDRMSSAELEVIYPELQRFDPAGVGRRVCGNCRAVFAAELGRCPSCGAPA